MGGVRGWVWVWDSLHRAMCRSAKPEAMLFLNRCSCGVSVTFAKIPQCGHTSWPKMPAAGCSTAVSLSSLRAPAPGASYGQYSLDESSNESWTIAGTNHQTRFILWSNTRFLLDKLWEKPLGKYEVSERLPKRYPRGLQEVSEGCPRGCERFCEEVSERSPRGSEEVFKRSPRGFREVSERFRRGIQDPRGFRGVSERL